MLDVSIKFTSTNIHIRRVTMIISEKDRKQARKLLIKKTNGLHAKKQITSNKIYDKKLLIA